MTKAVILDAYSINPGDIDWAPLTGLFDECIVYADTKLDEVNDRIKEAEYVFTNRIPITENNLQTAQILKYIGVAATGYNAIDIEAAAKHNVTVANSPNYSTDSVAQFAVALILAHTNRVAETNQMVQAGGWTDSLDLGYWYGGITELKDKTLGLVGFGDIAKQTAKIAQAFGMNVIVSNRSSIDVAMYSVKQVSFSDLLMSSDFISIHVPLAENTYHLFDADAFDKMKPTAFLINTARGAIIDQEALAHALTEGQIAGAGIDVLEEEPIQEQNPLLGVPNLYITPHVAWASVEARTKLIQLLADNAANFMEGKPTNVVNR